MVIALCFPGIFYILYGIYMICRKRMINLREDFRSQSWTSEYITEQGKLDIIFGALLFADSGVYLLLGGVAGFLFLILLGILCILGQYRLFQKYKKKIEKPR